MSKSEILERLMNAKAQRAYYAGKLNSSFFNNSDDVAEFEKWKSIQESLEEMIEEMI